MDKLQQGMDKEKFRGVVNGHKVALYQLHNSSGVEVLIMNHGAKIVAIKVPDREGQLVDVILGHDSLGEYIKSEEQYFGAICGRYANRIAKGQFSIDGIPYSLKTNNGPNALHGGIKGFNDVVWQVEESTGSELQLSYTSADGEEGYPGTLRVEVTYSLSDTNSLSIAYRATTDKATVLNLTNHAYFNLSGEGNPTVHDHLLTINAEEYLPTDNTSIPLEGTPQKVEGTPFDFREPHLIGERVDNDNEQLKLARGYDHTFVINKPLGAMGVCAVCSSPKTGIELTVESDQPGVQLYTANWLSGNMRGKHGHRYPARSAVCFETQHYPDSPNRPDYPSTLLRAGEVFESKTIFRFGLAGKQS